MSSYDDSEELKYLDFLDAIGIEKVQYPKSGNKAYGYNPIPTESQQKAIEKLSNKLILKSNDDELVQKFNILNLPRVILYEGKALKRSTNSLIQHLSKRNLILLNDVLIICSIQSNTFGSDKFIVKNILNLSHLSINSNCNDPSNSIAPPTTPGSTTSASSEVERFSFELRTNQSKLYHFIIETESEHRIWLEELKTAIYCIKLSSQYANQLNPGWIHEVIRGTLHSAAYFGDNEFINSYFLNISDIKSIVNERDELGMTALHWACFENQLSTVELLLSYESNVDELNNGLNSSLMLACAKGYDNIVAILLNYNCDVFIRNLKDRDALYMSFLYAPNTRGLYTIMQSMINQGVDINQG